MTLHSTYIYFILFALLSIVIECHPITNSNFNEHVREYSLKEDNINSSNVKTLQNSSGRYANMTSVPNFDRLKNNSDNDLSSSSHSRGFMYEDKPVQFYEEIPYHNYGHGYPLPEIEQYQHGLEYYEEEYRGHPPHHVEQHRHYNHALATKAVLWPLAGIALLGAAAALVSNPILLQLGVATGKRRRRDTEELLSDEILNSSLDNRQYLNNEDKSYKIRNNIGKPIKLESGDGNDESSNSETSDEGFIKISTNHKSARTTHNI